MTPTDQTPETFLERQRRREAERATRRPQWRERADRGELYGRDERGVARVVETTDTHRPS